MDLVHESMVERCEKYVKKCRGKACFFPFFDWY